jgi:hypothetical protein
LPCAYSAAVSATATPTGGRKLSRNLRPGPVLSATRARRAFETSVPAATSPAAAAVTSQTPSQLAAEACCEATSAASNAIAPIATPPQPGTAVNEPLRSMAWRMKRRSSIARSCNAVGGGVPGGRGGVGMAPRMIAAWPLCQVLFNAKYIVHACFATGPPRLEIPGGRN